MSNILLLPNFKKINNHICINSNSFLSINICIDSRRAGLYRHDSRYSKRSFPKDNFLKSKIIQIDREHIIARSR